MNFQDALNRLSKWRSVFAGWQLGTRSDTDQECKAVKDHREATLILRAEVNAITALLINMKVFTADQFQDQVAEEANHLSKVLEKRFPGMKATDIGITYSLPEAAETMKN